MDRAIKQIVYVLKNHNGTVLSKHICPKELAKAMAFYEYQTGNETRISVES